MIRRIVNIFILTFLISACGAAAPAATQAPATEEFVFTEEATEPPVESLLPESSPTLQPTATPEATFIPSSTPTDTPLPPLELPTEAANAPSKMVWDGMPTYLGDSTPGFMFRVTYDPDLWALTHDQFGFPALGHRNIPYCVIAVTAGRGMPANVTVEHDVLYIGTVTFDVGIAYENGIKKSVTYTGGDGIILTAFEVSFQEEADACIADAVTVLSTLISVPVSQATPQP